MGEGHRVAHVGERAVAALAVVEHEGGTRSGGQHGFGAGPHARGRTRAPAGYRVAGRRRRERGGDELLADAHADAVDGGAVGGEQGEGRGFEDGAADLAQQMQRTLVDGVEAGGADHSAAVPAAHAAGRATAGRSSGCACLTKPAGSRR